MRFELGFDSKSLISQPRIVHGLVPGSAAAAAGLRDGDEIAAPVGGLDSIQGDQNATLTLQIRRNGAVTPLTYLPRGEITDAYQWRRVPGVPDKKCGI